MYSSARLTTAPSFDPSLCAEVALALRSGCDVPDSYFDQCLPEELRRASTGQWTPLDVARRVSEWIGQLGIRTVVDIGAGAGKFCVTSALLSNARFLGIEHRARLVTASRKLAEAFGVSERVAFEWGVVGRRPIPQADAYYLYNPFGENLAPSAHQFDQEVQLSAERYEQDVEWIRQFLHGVPVGTYVITYNGYGALLPSSFFDVCIAKDQGLPLKLSKKVSVH